MLIRAPAIVCSVRPHGETGAIVRVMTADHGLAAAFVPGARGRTLRPVLIPGNQIAIEVRARAGAQLPTARVELVSSRGPWLSEPLPSAGITWACALTASTLPEGHAYPLLHDSLAALLDAICHAPSARGWARVLAGYEVLLLREVGYGAAPAPPPEEDWESLLARLERQGKAIANRLLAERARDVMGARTILLDRLRRIGGG
ncbi:MAG: DNA recombination protein RecO [Novosphingobium sp. 28-62-57]|uniref:DNA repair protein RecO n=1 Tax=unclassified Novosphingobium TaxID=2644732 RepID=UPI000BCB69B8|nr:MULTISPECIES: recombination protein O N-terminal domain-containing protein [unclassified Novosphingobium]OYW48555.1 MAG: DNA recombination protein RecO [Novosphingobium sp. 12-62-10]OYZ31303.1 MAG: DNA recombination protein RecO [Novosphingobium sp. 16-62-11]OZA38018.1 MAG: DNA recombination protein RecO [Novosphingobium sp. 17-62-9]OYZ08511.1 MAG: DNA recombination protein RecO [Novosphingobium sp. 28-62-57]HQS69106.1 recombination protein O N-terminal domain-containing protein [Novosphing